MQGTVLRTTRGGGIIIETEDGTTYASFTRWPWRVGDRVRFVAEIGKNGRRRYVRPENDDAIKGDTHEQLRRLSFMQPRQ